MGINSQLMEYLEIDRIRRATKPVSAHNPLMHFTATKEKKPELAQKIINLFNDRDSYDQRYAAATEIRTLLLNELAGDGQLFSPEGACKMFKRLEDIESGAVEFTVHQRDHVIHAIYVFLLGLAVYTHCSEFRKHYKDWREGMCPGAVCDRYFLHDWILTALFHNLGYSFEVLDKGIRNAFKKFNEAVAAFPSSRLVGNKSSEGMCYRTGTSNFTGSDTLVYNGSSIFDIIYAQLEDSDGFSRMALENALIGKKGIMNHGIISAITYIKYFDFLFFVKNGDKDLFYSDYAPPAVAIFLHSLSSKDMGRKISIEKYPLVWLLKISDSMQEWNRSLSWLFRYHRHNDHSCYNYDIDKYDSERRSYKYNFNSLMRLADSITGGFKHEEDRVQRIVNDVKHEEIYKWVNSLRSELPADYVSRFTMEEIVFDSGLPEESADIVITDDKIRFSIAWPEEKYVHEKEIFYDSVETDDLFEWEPPRVTTALADMKTDWARQTASGEHEVLTF